MALIHRSEYVLSYIFGIGFHVPILSPGSRFCHTAVVEHFKDPMSIQNPPVKKEEPANHPTAEGGPAVVEGSLEAAEGCPAAAYIVHIAERQDA